MPPVRIFFCTAAAIPPAGANRIDARADGSRGRPGKGAIRILSQRGPEERAFHIVNREGVSGEKSIDITQLDQAHEMFAGARPHDGRSRQRSAILRFVTRARCNSRPSSRIIADFRFVRVNSSC